MGMSRALTAESLTYYLTTGAVASRPTGWELALHTDYPGVDGLSHEVSDAAYVRQSITFERKDTPTGEPYVENDTLIIFPMADSGYTVTHITVWSSAGELLLLQPLRTPKAIAAEGQAQVVPGEIKIGAS